MFFRSDDIFAFRVTLLTVILVFMPACDIRHRTQVASATNVVSTSRGLPLPAGASCLMEPLFGDDENQRHTRNVDLHLKPVANFKQSLINASQNTVQFLYSATDQTKAAAAVSDHKIAAKQRRHQVAFESVCGGWRNTGTSTAIWVYDDLRGALVAKFVYLDASELHQIDWEARLTSPIFPPVPDYHSMSDSKYYSSCKVSFRSYATIPSHLDFSLVSMKTNQRYPLKQIIENQKLKLKQVAQKSGESAAWTGPYELTLPDLVTKTPFKLEFAVILAFVTSSATTQHNYLNGVAIANFSLSPQCFGLDVEEEELSRIKSITGKDPPLLSELKVGREGGAISQERSESSLWFFYRQFTRFIEVHKTFILISVIIILILVVFCTQCLLCAYNHRRNQINKQPLWAQVCCCSFHNKQHSRAHNVLDGKHANNNNQLENGGDDRYHLCPLFSPDIFDLELTVNPNYLSSGAWSAKSANTPLEPYHIERKQLTLTVELGKGAFGKVYQGYLVAYGTDDTNELQQVDNIKGHSVVEVAVKALTEDRMSQTDFIREAINMSLVKHRNIIKLLGVCFEDKPLYIVMELLSGGNLKNFLLKNRDRGYYNNNNNGRITTPTIQLASLVQGKPNTTTQARNNSFMNIQAPQSPPTATITNLKAREDRVRLCMGDLLVFALDIARACDFLQKQRFIHRDLAARNCLLTAGTKMAATHATNPPPPPTNYVNHRVDLEQVFLNGYMNSSIVAKLADFGMTRDVYSNDYYRVGHKEMPVRWMPPECLDGVATTKSDVWSFGVFLWELFSMGQLPYQNLLNNVEVVEFIKSRRYAKPKQQQQHVQYSSCTAGTSAGKSARVSQGSTDNPETLLLTISDDNVSQYNVITTTGSNHHPNSCFDDLLEADENEAADLPPLPPPHDNTPLQIYSIMCSCWANNPEDRPQFEEIANRLYWCLQVPELLSTSLPCFYEQHTPGGSFPATPPGPPRFESRHSGATQPNWWSP